MTSPLDLDRQRQLLKRWEPVFVFAASEPPLYPHGERFQPMPVELFLAASSLRVEYRLFGFFSLRQAELIPPGKVTPSDLRTPPDDDRSLWNRLGRWAFITRQHSLVFVQEAEIDQARQEARAALEQTLLAAPPTRKTRLQLLALVAFGLAPITCCLFTFFDPGLALAVLASLTLWGLAGRVGRRDLRLSLALFWLGTTPSCFLVLSLLNPVSGLVWPAAIAWGIYTILFFLGSTLGYWNNVVDLISPLPNENADLAARKYGGMVASGAAPPTYYGRVWQPEGDSRWRYVLQYWMFYAFNDWRTAHGGLDDHEGDWEMLQVCVPKNEGQQAVIVFSQHNRAQPVVLEDGRPQCFIAAGSHANYPRRAHHPLSTLVVGQKSALSISSVASLVLNLAERLARGLPEVVRRARASYQAEGLSGTREVVEETLQEHRLALVVDRATGGLQPEVGRDLPWRGELLDGEADWVHFKGRWGRSVIFPPESGPGGPRYHQDGRERLAWVDPLGWAGLEP